MFIVIKIIANSGHESFIDLTSIEKRDDFALKIMSRAIIDFEKQIKAKRKPADFGLSRDDIEDIPDGSYIKQVLWRELDHYNVLGDGGKKFDVKILTMLKKIVDQKDGEKAWMIFKSKLYFENGSNFEIINIKESLPDEEICNFKFKFVSFEVEEF